MAENDPLAKMILQPATEQATITDEGVYTETWKGPWSQIKLVTSTQKIFNTTLIIGQKRPRFNNGNWAAEIAPPETLDSDWPWVIQNIQIRQEASGDNGYLTIEYKSQIPNIENSDPDGGTDPAEPGDDDYQQEFTDSRTWTLTWQTFNRSVLEYSSNPDAVIKFKQQPTGEAWTYYTDSTQARTAVIPQTTDNKERKIATYYTKDVSPQFHYPVVTYHQEYTLPEGKQVYTAIGSSIDRKTNLPGICPFAGQLAGWQWIQTADTGTITNSRKYKVDDTPAGGSPSTKGQTEFKYVRETSWQGARKWDDNFYGVNAWQPVQN